MPRHPTTEELGEPAIKIEGFQLWVHGWAYPEATDYYDANWLRATAHCGATGASVWVAGTILQAPDVTRWDLECKALENGQAEMATLASFEPELEVEIRRLDQLGHFLMRIQITPDHLTQEHTFKFGIDQTYLPEIMRQCRGIKGALLDPRLGVGSRRGV